MKKILLEKCKDLGIEVKKNYTKEKLKELIVQRGRISNTELIPLASDSKTKKDVKYIYHLADIHIRAIDRHEEYNTVFENLYKKIEDPDESIIVLCGDIFHNKDRFTSETIIVFNDFIKKLSSITTVIVIAGNHDCFNHSNRLDSLSGIVSVVNHNNLFYLKKSGIYSYKNLQFGVSSLVDGGPIISSSELDSKRIKIALYHGAVGNADIGNNILYKGLDLEVFQGYDYVLLGDIHKRQFLAPNIAYPGSLIQQNHGEELSHGFLKWDLETKKAEYIPVENDYSFITLEYSDKLDLSNIKFTKYSRIKVLINDIHDVDIGLFEEELKKYTDVISVKKALKTSKLIDSIDSAELNHENKEVNIQKKEVELITKLKPDEAENLLKLHKEYSAKESQNQDLSNNRDSMSWTITSLEFKNIFSYGKDILNKIDFKNTGITGILGENAIGKSSILNTILYGVFGNVYKSNTYTNKNIISKYASKEPLYVKVCISTNDKIDYVIERTAKNKKRATGIGMEETLRFYMVNNQIKELNLSTKTETEALIREKLSIIGKQEFILTNLLSNVSYGFNGNMLSMTNVQLEETFETLFDLQKYSNINRRVKEDFKKLNSEKRKIEEEMKYLINNLEEIENQENEIKIENYKEQIKIKREEKKELEKELNEISKEITLNSVGIGEDSCYNPPNKNKETIQKEIKECKNLLGKISKKDLQEYTERKKDIKKELSSLLDVSKPKIILDDDYYPSKSVEELEIEIKLTNDSRYIIDPDSYLSEEYFKAKKLFKKINAQPTLNPEDIVSILKDLKTKDSYCLLPLEMRDNLVNDLSTKAYIDPNEILNCKNIMNKKEERDRKILENIKKEEKIQELQVELSSVKAYNNWKDYYRKENLKEQLKMIDISGTLEELIKDLDYLEKNKETEELITKKNILKKKIDTLEKELESLIRNLSISENTLKEYDIIDNKFEELVKTAIQLSKKVKILHSYYEITQSKNLPKIIIKDTIKSLVNTANKVIYNMTGLLCNITEVNDKWEITLKKNNMYLGAEHCSGYERFIINTGLKLGLDKYKFLSSIKMFLIDEVIDCVSEENIERIYELLDILKKNYSKVIVISHNEELKKKVEYKINIKQKNNCSYLV